MVIIKVAAPRPCPPRLGHSPPGAALVKRELERTQELEYRIPITGTGIQELEYRIPRLHSPANSRRFPDIFEDFRNKTLL